MYVQLIVMLSICMHAHSFNYSQALKGGEYTLIVGLGEAKPDPLRLADVDDVAFLALITDLFHKALTFRASSTGNEG
jgi:hypothetical protein